MSQSKIRMKFELRQNGQLLRTEELDQDIVKVGKLASSHLHIDDDNVSRMHAVIEVTGGNQVFVVDLGSASGTFVNDEKVSKKQIKSGDMLRFGSTDVQVSITEQAPAAAAAPPTPAKPAAPPAPAKPAAPPTPAKPAGGVPNPFAAKPGLPNPFAAPTPAAKPKKKKSDVLPDDFDDSDIDPELIVYKPRAVTGPVDTQLTDDAGHEVEVTILWGERSVLHVAHVGAEEGFIVGSDEAASNYLMGEEALGASSLPVVVAEAGANWAVVPQGAEGFVLKAGNKVPLTELPLQACASLPGAQQIQLEPDQPVNIMHRGFTFRVQLVARARVVGGGFTFEWGVLPYCAAVMAFFAIIATAAYFLVPPVAAIGNNQLDLDNRLVQYVINPPETEEPEPPDFMQGNEANAGGEGQRARDEEGAMGDENSRRTNNRYAIEGNAENPQMAREQAREMAANAGILGTLAAMSGAFNSPTSPYGADQAIGSDPMSALGAMMGDSIGANSGFGGLGLSGTGAGGGGTGAGTIGMGNFGTIGHGGGRGGGQGYGSGGGGLRGRQAARPRVRAGTAAVRGSLSREVIRRVVRRHQNEVRFCYEQGLHSRPDLAGRVKVKFVITPTGRVQTSMVQQSSLGNRQVEQCIARSVRRWTFPAPDGGGIVVVSYPFVLSSS